MSNHPKPEPRSNLRWVAIDLDGTLATPAWSPENPTSEIGVPIWRNAVKAMELHDAGFKIVIHTARPDSDYEAIEAWLLYYGIPYKTIRTGKVLAAAYIDDRGINAGHDEWLPILKAIIKEGGH